MMKSRLLILTGIILFLGLPLIAQTPVMLRVVKAEQQDTIGCNIVSEITSYVYSQLIAGNIKLWDSPEKEIQITGTSLKEIENSSHTSFIDQEIIYIYEYWSGSGKNLKSVTSGFSFSSKSSSGGEVNYGYVDCKEFKDQLFSISVKGNANANFNATLGYYLNGKHFYYHIIQYGGNVIDNIKQSEEIKSQLTNNTGHFPDLGNSSVEIPQKLVFWMMDDNDNSDKQKYMNARKFVNTFQDYFSSNKEVFFNLGGDKIKTHMNEKSSLKISKVLVKELWKKIDGKIQYDPVSVTFYLNDTALTEILYRDMVKMEVTIGMNSWIEFIKGKTFSYTLYKINSQPISRAESFIYLKGLQTYDWKKVTEYVKYY